MLFGIVAATPAGYAVAFYYILIYALMALAGLGLLTLISNDNGEVENIQQLRGLNKHHPWLAFLMMVVMLSMAGVPPTVGFFTKLLVLKALVDVHLTWIAIAGLIFAVLGAYYYINIIKSMYFDEPEAGTIIALNTTNTARSLYSINCLSLLYLGLFPAWLLTKCLQAFL